MAIIDLMGLIELALKAALIYAGSFVLVWLGAMYGADEANSTQARTGDETDRQLRKQAIARSAGLMIACLPVVIWIIWTCVQAANSSPD
jgi:threonine/homoserine/homoserine lactone efflux protein